MARQQTINIKCKGENCNRQLYTWQVIINYLCVNCQKKKREQEKKAQQKLF